MRFLEESVKRINSLLNASLSDPREKESHPGKKLSEHVEECIHLSSFIADAVGLDDPFKRFSYILCELHDIGKLHPGWGFSVKGFSHSKKGAEMLQELRNRGKLDFLGLDDKSTDLLITMVGKHHSSLKLSSYKEYKVFSKLSFDEALNYADSFGIFKLADFASATSMVEEIKSHFEREWPGESSFAAPNIDEEKLRKQMEIAGIGDLVLSAPTGWGKTMVGVLKAVKDRPLKFFYCLPTITAIRKMKEDFELKFGGDSVGEYFYFADFDLLKERGEETDLLEMYRFFVPKVNITTVDQLLLTMMRAGKYHLRRFQFRKSLIVIDEYHLLPPKMLGALIEVLSRYSKPYGIKLLLMTATPISAYRKALSSLSLSEVDLSNEYSKLRRHKIEMISEDESVGKVIDLLNEGKRVLVILNTVDRAIDFYRKLDVKGKLLLHSRFSVKDRYEKEKMIEECRVLVSTQVAEVSLDVSFDALVSEAAPVPSVIQRTGRVNRYGKSTDRTNVYLIKVRDYEPYSKEEVEYSIQAIEERLDDLQKGENAYLSMLADYSELVESFLEKEILNAREYIAEKIFEGNKIMSIELDEELLSKSLRGETNVLVVPNIYEEKVRELISKMREEKSYQERKKIYSEIKGYLAPLRISLARHCRGSEGMPFLVADGEKFYYDSELGIVDRCPP